MSFIKQLVIDSADRESGTSSNFRVHIDNGEVIRNFNTVSLMSANIPESHYNVTSDNNSVTADSQTVTLQDGNYSAELLSAELQSLLNASASAITFEVKYNAINGKITVSGDSTFILDLSSSDAANDVLGFENESFATSTSHTGLNVVNLHVNHYGIRIDQLGRDIMRPDQSNWATWGIMSTGNAFAVSLFVPRPSDLKVYSVPGSINYLDISLVDSQGFEIDLNGVEWSLVLQFD